MRMKAKACWIVSALLLLSGCGGSEPPAVESAPVKSEPRQTVFDPWIGTMDRAKGVQNTVDDQSAELRRRVDEAER